jgi:phage baseplate assembly protein W
MSGISPKLPLSIAKIEGAYGLNKNLQESIQQNLKNLILTAPGEKIFDIRFGVGLRTFLFENANSDTSEKITYAIQDQVAEYMPFVKIKELDVNLDPDNNRLSVYFNYIVPVLTLEDTLSLEITRN